MYTCIQLEELEKEAIESLNKAKYMNLKIVGENLYNYPIGVNKKRNNFKKQVNKSIENLNMNEISEKNDDEQNNPNKSVYVKNNKEISPSHKNQNKDLNF